MRDRLNSHPFFFLLTFSPPHTQSEAGLALLKIKAQQSTGHPLGRRSNPFKNNYWLIFDVFIIHTGRLQITVNLGGKGDEKRKKVGSSGERVANSAAADLAPRENLTGSFVR